MRFVSMRPVSRAFHRLWHGSNKGNEELEELRTEALRTLLVGITVSVYLPAAWLVIAPPRYGSQEAWILCIALWGTCFVSYLTLVWLGCRSASITLVLGLMGCIVAAAHLYPESLSFLGFSLVVVIAGLLLGPIYGLGTALGATALVVLGRQLSTDLVSDDVATAALLLVWASSFLSWLSSRPLFLALDWSIHAYEQANRKTEEARTRQEQLGVVTKSLNEAYSRLETLNHRLDQSREEAERAWKSKAEFASILSHELRTPLNLILGLSEMMQTAPQAYGSDRLPPPYQADVDAIYRNAHHLAGLVDDVLDLGRMEASTLGLAREVVDLVGTVLEALEAVRPRFEDLGLALKTEFEAELPLAYVDRTRVRQVLINLLNNASRFTDCGSVSVSVKRQEDQIVVSVTDTGVGIAVEELPHVFEEFYQASNRHQNRSVGSGLGLAISKRLILLHGGRMWCESQVGVGSTFAFSLPLVEAEGSRSVLGRPRSWPRTVPARKPIERCIAVVGGISAAAFYQRHLDGYRVVSVDVLEQLPSLANRMPLSGAIVPCESLSECWESLCQADGWEYGLPIVMCALPDSRDLAADLGVSSYLAKPVTRCALAQALERTGKSARVVLVIDDNADMVRLLTRMVRSLGRRYRVWHATSGPEALVVMRERTPDVVLLDLAMPEMDGYALLRAMRADEKLRDVRVIVVSAYGTAVDSLPVGVMGITRLGGLSVIEMMRCLKVCFDAL